MQPDKASTSTAPIQINFLQISFMADTLPHQALQRKKLPLRHGTERKPLSIECAASNNGEDCGELSRLSISLQALRHRLQNRIVIGFMSELLDELCIAEGALLVHHKHRTGQEPQLLDEHTERLAKGRIAMV